LTWALGKKGAGAPKTYDDAMGNGFVFTMKKCLSTDTKKCKWRLASEAADELVSKAVEEDHHVHLTHSLRKRDTPVNDPCTQYTSCTPCINAKDYCGWCSVNVFYNFTIKGGRCAGINKTKIPGFTCNGAFSTVDCPTSEPPSSPPTTLPPTSIPPLRPTSPVAPPPPTKPVVMYVCNPATQKCEQNATAGGGMPLEQCNLTCNLIPDVPVVLRNRKFRGLQININYFAGEYTVKFNQSTATFTSSKGVTFTAIVSQTGQYLVLNLPSGGKIYTLWQISEDAVVDFLSWSWGSLNGPAPKNFDESMTADGQTSYVFDGCSSLSTVCNFGQ